MATPAPASSAAAIQHSPRTATASSRSDPATSISPIWYVPESGSPSTPASLTYPVKRRPSIATTIRTAPTSVPTVATAPATLLITPCTLIGSPVPRASEGAHPNIG